MADAQPELQWGPQTEVYSFAPAVACPECGGAGTIALLVTAPLCQGMGHVWRHEWLHDEQGRRILGRQWFEPAAAEAGDEQFTDERSGTIGHCRAGLV